MSEGRSDPLIVAIDQGTTGSTVLLVDCQGQVQARCSQEFPQYFPQPGWVEHEPEEIWRSVRSALRGALAQLPGAVDRLAAVGITNQRETALLWDAETSAPLGRAVVWQDRRTADVCDSLRQAGHTHRVREVTGLVIDPYFSATKVARLLAENAQWGRQARRGQVQFGTVDSFLVKKLAGGVAAPHIMEVTNASRTLLMDLKTRNFSSEMCQLFEVPEQVLPRIVASAQVVAHTTGVPELPDGLPISGIAGDQHAALFGQGCVNVGDAKCTYGTGAFVLVNTGERPLESEAGLLSTLAWQIGEEVNYALEGSCFISGAAVQWLRDGLGIIDGAEDIEKLARSVSSSGQVVFVPALSGLGAPYWDAQATGLITGITRGTTRAHLARATLEAMAFQVDDLLLAMDADLKNAQLAGVTRLRVDGGAAKNDLLVEIQAGLSHCRVDRPAELESTGRGAALLAALGAGLVAGVDQAASAVSFESHFGGPGSEEELPLAARQAARRRWEQAVARARS